MNEYGVEVTMLLPSVRLIGLDALSISGRLTLPARPPSVTLPATAASKLMPIADGPKIAELFFIAAELARTMLPPLM